MLNTKIAKSWSIVSAIALLLTAALPIWSESPAHADETVGEKVETKIDEAKQSTKKGARKAKKAARDATGNGSVIEDAKDGLNNTGESIGAEARKAKRKAD